MNELLTDLRNKLQPYSGIDVRKLAKKCNVSYKTLYMIKGGHKNNITLVTYQKITKGLENDNK